MSAENQKAKGKYQKAKMPDSLFLSSRRMILLPFDICLLPFDFLPIAIAN
jgi:hypothetical protein